MKVSDLVRVSSEMAEAVEIFRPHMDSEQAVTDNTSMVMFYLETPGDVAPMITVYHTEKAVEVDWVRKSTNYDFVQFGPNMDYTDVNNLFDVVMAEVQAKKGSDFPFELIGG